MAQTPDEPNRLMRLLGFFKDTPGSVEIEPYLQKMVGLAADLLESEDCSILLYDSEQRCLRFVAGPADQLATLKNLGIPLERSIAGWVYTHGRSIRLDEAEQDERIFRVVDREVSEDTRSLLAVPLIDQGETIGVLEAVNRRGGENYTEEDLFLLETLAAQAAWQIQNRRKHERVQRENERLLGMDQVKSGWIAVLAHELRGTLSLIMGRAGLMLESDHPQTRDNAGAILDAVGRLKGVASQLDALEAFERLAPRVNREKIDARELATRVAGTFIEQAAARKIALLVEVPEGLVFEGDPAKLAVVLRNLVENALVYTNEGGWVRIWAEALPGYFKFVVIDRGIGISEEEQPRVFDRFYRGKGAARRHKGPGLGLSIARELVELHGGDIWLESADGQGSTVAFLIPEHL